MLNGDRSHGNIQNGKLFSNFSADKKLIINIALTAATFARDVTGQRSTLRMWVSHRQIQCQLLHKKSKESLIFAAGSVKPKDSERSLGKETNVERGENEEGQEVEMGLFTSSLSFSSSLY